MYHERAIRQFTAEDPNRASVFFLLLAALAVAFGFYGRFKGLEYAPVSVDEYYLSRAVDGILKYGYPAFDCGGIYQRGLGLQYLIALLRLTGLSPELSGRLLCACASLITLPAAYSIARRFMSANTALIALAVLSLSMWEIELARFGRMYAPFQAVFTLYVMYFLRYVVDREAKAMRSMLTLTIIGALMWEGAVFLALANFFPPMLSYIESRRLQRNDWILAAVAAPVFAGTFWLVRANLRFTNDQPLPPGYSPTMIDAPVSKLDLIRPQSFAFFEHLYPAILFCILLIACVPAMRWIWSQRSQPTLMLGLLTMLAGALAHQFLIPLSIGIILLLLKQLSPTDFQRRGALWLLIAMSLAAFFWIIYSALMTDWPKVVADTGSTQRAFTVFIYQFMRVPNVIGVTVRPFFDAVPKVSLVLFVGIAIATVRTIFSTDSLRSPERILLLLLILLMLGIGLSDPPRSETRYAAFLYPLAILIVIKSLSATIALVRWPASAAAAPALCVFLLFALTEDVNFSHIAQVDTPEVTFRTGMSPDMQAHIEIRDDVRGIAEWLRPRVATERAVVVNGVHGFDYYYPNTLYFFAEEHSPNFPDWSCRRGTVDRWTNLPLVFTYEDLKAKTADFKTYLVTFALTPTELARLADRGGRVVLTKGLVSVVAMDKATKPNY